MGLGQLGCGVQVVFHIDHRLDRIKHPVVDHRVDLHRDVVLRDDVLRRDVEGDGAQVHLDHLVDGGEHQDQTRPLGARQHLAEPEDHRALVLPDDLDPIQKEEEQENDGNGRKRHTRYHN